MLISRERRDRGQGGWLSWSLLSQESLLWRRLEREPNFFPWVAKTKAYKLNRESLRLYTWK